MIINNDDIVNAVSNLNILELNDLVKKFEKKYGISIENIEKKNSSNIEKNTNLEKNEKTEFSVILSEVGGSKVSVIKIVRELTGLGLKESKNLVDSSPKSIKDGLTKIEAEKIKKKLELVGAKVTIK